MNLGTPFVSNYRGVAQEVRMLCFEKVLYDPPG